MTNKLYRQEYIREVTLSNGEILKYKSGNGNIRYGITDEKRKDTVNWDEFLLSHLGFIKEFHGYTNRKGRVWCEVDYTDKYYNRCQKKVYKDEFVSSKSYYKMIDVLQNETRMKRLVEDLSADQFVLFLKDNGIGELPIQ